MACNSRANQAYYELRWGKVLGGKYEKVRKRPLDKFEDFFAIMPRISAAARGRGLLLSKEGKKWFLGLQKEHLDHLCADETF